jgi:hypothetical protein
MNKGRMSVITSRRLRLATAICLLAGGDASAGTITVGGACGLQDAITAAETDTATGGCAAGSGEDTVALTGDVTLTSAGGNTGFEDSGLPPIGSTITIQGNGYRIARDPGAANFEMIEVASTGVLTLDHVTLSGGAGIDAGGIENRGHLTLVDSTISGNTGGNVGGVINLNLAATDTTLTVIRSLFADNHGSGNGGAIFNYAGHASLSNCTLSGNSANFGGALNNSASFGSKPAASATLDHCTLSGNTATFTGQILNQNDAQLTLIGTVVNGDYNCSGNAPPIDGGANFSSDGSCGGAAILSGFDATLRANGGPTLTHALLPDSNAIDAGGACALATDARGIARDGHCDSGSYEFSDAIFRNGFESP